MANPLVRDSLLFGLMAPVGLLGWRNNALVTAILGLAFLISAIFLYSRKEALFFVFVGVFGVTLEIIGSSVGMWTYTKPNFLTVPIWIFFSWGFSFLPLYSAYALINAKL